MLVSERVRPLKLRDGQVVHQIGIPYHWGERGIATGDSANDLLGVHMDANTHIQESKAATCDIQPGRRPRGPELRRVPRGVPPAGRDRVRRRPGGRPGTGGDLIRR